MSRWIGPRLWKTGLAVAVTVVLVRLTGHPYEAFGGIAAALAVAPSASRSWQTGLHQLIAHILGGIAGWAAISLLGPNPLVIGGTVIGVLLLAQTVGWRDVSTAAVTVALFVMAPHADSAAAAAFWRLVAVAIGTVVGAAVNILLLPPDHRPAAVTAVLRAGLELDAFTLSIAGRLARPDAMAKAEVLTGAGKVEKAIAEARRLQVLDQESRGVSPDTDLLGRSVKVLSSLLERIQVVHKAALTAQRAVDYADQLPDMQETLVELVDLRRALYGRLVGDEAEDTLPVRLLELERRYETPQGMPACEAEVEEFFRLYRMRSSLSYMANRLGRLYVAMDGAATHAPTSLPMLSRPCSR